METIKDLIYFDKEKALSIYSQLYEGITKELSKSESKQKGKKRRLGFNLFNIFKPSFERNKSEEYFESQLKEFHHNLLNIVERDLKNRDILLDFDNEKNHFDFEDLRVKISDYAYLTAEGWVVIEDYTRLDNIASRFNELNTFINRCTLQETEVPEGIKKYEDEITNLKRQIKNIKDPNQRNKELKKIQGIERKLEKEILEYTDANGVDDWLIDGIHLFIETFLPNRINLRLFPLENHPDFQMLANLKKDCFVDDDFENFLFSYGAEPNIKFKILGLITSIPPKHGNEFDTMSEYNLVQENQLSDKESLEKAFRNMFREFDNFEQYARYSRYPNIVFNPIAVYRELKTNK